MVDKIYWEKTAYSWVSKCESLILTLDNCDTFNLVKCTFDWSTRRRSSRGGWYGGPGISIAMNICVKPNLKDVIRVYEYPSFDLDKDIGGFYTRNTEHILAMHICHEMAHAVQYYRKFTHKGNYDRPHGNSFKNPYKKLRVNLLNPVLPDQKQLKQEYNTYLRKFK